MKKVIICSNCTAENPFYSLTCKECNSYLRSRVPNIDLWATISKILYAPITTAETLIQTDHKNFVVSLMILAGIKLSLFVAAYYNSIFAEDTNKNIFVVLIFGILFFCAAVSFISLIVTMINKLFGLKTRFKDNLTIYVYSYLPTILLLVFLTPIYFALFGIYWFSFNPSPFMIKPTSAYVLAAFEGVFFLWSMFLSITSTYAQSKSGLYSLLVGLSFNSVVVYLLLFFYKILI
ncbi:MAG: hypothetical protein HYS25_15615 [Ignavibacteriales bacterium]|nr:hypothetical protein [Ignavibacteriales bacterium]